jgi:hypothetical protein
MGPLSVGDVVSAGLRIYRDHFKLYFRLAFIAYLWILVPIYGWAKFSAISGLLSRLAFQELLEQPETVSEARRHVMPRMWSFLLAGFLVGLIMSGIIFAAVIVFGILGVVVGMIIGQGAATTSAAAILVLSLVGFIVLIALFVGYLWLVSRLLIVEVPLAVESNVDSSSAISRSWVLTKGFALRLILVATVAFLITLPITIVVQIFSTIIQGLLSASIPQDSPTFLALYYLLILPISFASGALLIPFWQSIKAVVYYDLRNRREGLDLQIRDSE